MRDIFILNDIRAQDKIHILVGNLIGRNIFSLSFISTGSEL
jgi:hypothetical protein